MVGFGLNERPMRAVGLTALSAGAAAFLTLLLPATANAACTFVGSGVPLVCTADSTSTVQAQSGASAAVTASQNITFQSSAAVLDRLTQLRGTQQGASQATPYAAANRNLGQDAFAAVFKAPPAAQVGPTFAPAAWIRGFGDFEKRDDVFGYSQRGGGFLVGADVVISNFTSARDGLVLGVMTGYTAARVSVNAGGTENFTGPSIGAYATYLNGNFFADFLVKADFLSLDIAVPGLPASANVRNYGATTNIGYKVNLANAWYIEPTVGLEYVKTNVSDQTLLVTTVGSLPDGYAWRGRAGARYGTDWISDGVRIEPSLTAFVYSVLQASGTSLIGTALATSPASDEGKVRGEFQGAVNFFNLRTGYSGFIRADLRFGNNYFGGGPKAGLRYQW